MEVDLGHLLQRVIERRDYGGDRYRVNGFEIKSGKLKQVARVHPVFVYRAIACRRQSPMRDQLGAFINTQRGVRVAGVNDQKHRLTPRPDVRLLRRFA